MAEYLYRRNTVLEALRGSRRQLHRLILQKGKGLPPAIAELMLERPLPQETVSKQQLNQLLDDRSHQGIALKVSSYPYSTIDEILDLAAARNEAPFLLLLDLVHGPQNIGILLRTAEACGVHGVIIQDRRAPNITPQVVIHSAGAAEHLLIAQVTNLAKTIDRLKVLDIWTAGLDMVDEAKPLSQVDLDMPIALVVGHEGQGLRRLVRAKCDFLLQLPMRGKVESLNAAVAGSIVLYAAWQARSMDER